VDLIDHMSFINDKRAFVHREECPHKIVEDDTVPYRRMCGAGRLAPSSHEARRLMEGRRGEFFG
jgi:hypothetical protein